jgi:hypothetical protein
MSAQGRLNVACQASWSAGEAGAAGVVAVGAAVPVAALPQPPHAAPGGLAAPPLELPVSSPVSAPPAPPPLSPSTQRLTEPRGAG